MKETINISHHVILCPRASNHLYILSEEEFDANRHTSVCCDTYNGCTRFFSSYTEEVPYPLVEIEELY